MAAHSSTAKRDLAARPSAGKIAWLARSGYAARGVVYLIVGGLAVLAALGGGGQTTDSKGALLTILQQPFGNVLLGLVALGLVGYAIWRLVQALMDTDHHGTDAKGLAIRGGLRRQRGDPHPAGVLRAQPDLRLGHGRRAAATAARRTGPPGCCSSRSGAGWSG